jgi:hypothetical protein
MYVFSDRQDITESVRTPTNDCNHYAGIEMLVILILRDSFFCSVLALGFIYL